MTRALVWLLLALLPASAALAQEDAPAREEPSYVHPDDELPPVPRWGRGPFEIQDVYLLALNRLSPWARSPQVLKHLQVELGFKGVWSNSYAFNRGRTVVDGEVRQAIGVLRLGLFDRLELGLWLPYEWRGGGTLDGFISDFHKTFGLPASDRDQRPKDLYAAFGTEKDGTPFNYEHSGFGFSDLISEARVQLYPGDELIPAATAVLRLRFPTGRPGFDLSDGVDVSLGLDASQRILDGPIIVYGGLAYTYYARGKVGGLRLARHRLFAWLGGELELTDYLSLVVHGWFETRRERKLWATAANLPPLAPKGNLDFANVITYVATGFKLELHKGLIFELGLMENVIDPENTADFTLMFNVTWRI